LVGNPITGDHLNKGTISTPFNRSIKPAFEQAIDIINGQNVAAKGRGKTDM
jgi:hypothetical protein